MNETAHAPGSALQWIRRRRCLRAFFKAARITAAVSAVCLAAAFAVRAWL